MENVVPASQVSKLQVTWELIFSKVQEIKDSFPKAKFYGIPRGGQIIAGLTGQAVNTVTEATHLIDDIKDSGKTAERWCRETGLPIVYLINKQEEKITDWLEFPWEVAEASKGMEDLVVRQLEMMGEDIHRDGLKGTPQRVAKMQNNVFGGYKVDPKTHLTVFEKGSYDQMIVLKNCEFYSMCEHHMVPFFGKIHIGYIPTTKVIGVSKLARIAEVFSRRLQIQERIGEQVTSFLMEHLQPRGCGCIIEAQHLCMMMRGVEKQNSIMMTSSLKGSFIDQQTKMEFLNFVKS